MKNLLVALLIVISSFKASAQKDVFWCDGGMSLARLIPGASVTYNHNVFRFMGLGAGVQLYDFHATKTNFQPVPALFWDLRLNINSKKRNQYFLFMDGGLNIYKRNKDYWTEGNSYYTVSHDNGTYYGLGVGYLHRNTDRRLAHYVSLKLIFNHYHADAFNRVTHDESVQQFDRGTIVLSYGFKF